MVKTPVNHTQKGTLHGVGVSRGGCDRKRGGELTKEARSALLSGKGDVRGCASPEASLVPGVEFMYWAGTKVVGSPSDKGDARLPTLCLLVANASGRGRKK